MATHGAYLKELKKIADNKAPPLPTTKTRVELETEIASISEDLKRPMPNVFRLDLIEARKYLRDQLSALQANAVSGS